MSKQTALEISFNQSAGFANAAGDISGKAKEAFDQLGSLLTDAINPLRQKIIEGKDSADEVEIRLDLALKSGGNWIIMSMEGGATVSVRLLWKKP